MNDSPVHVEAKPDNLPPKDEYLNIELVNTSAKNKDGTNRQIILKALDNFEPPFNSGSADVSLQEYQKQEKRVYGVFINDIQIGDVPEYITQYIYDNIERCKGITHINTFGGEGNKKYGAEITLTFSNSPAPSNEFEFVPVKVVGVTFNNDDGESRQDYLHDIRFKRPPFSGPLEVTLNQGEYNGEIAYSVCVNGYQIGNVPKSQVAYVHENYDRILEVSKINVYGGGTGKEGQPISFGAEITLKLCPKS